jgi:hypothetical protein
MWPEAGYRAGRAGNQKDSRLEIAEHWRTCWESLAILTPEVESKPRAQTRRAHAPVTNATPHRTWIGQA